MSYIKIGKMYNTSESSIRQFKKRYEKKHNL